MRTTKILSILVSALSLVAWSAAVSKAAPLGTAFTYQGRFIDANNAADGIYDFQFKLYNDPCTGSQQGSAVDINELDVIDGYFTVGLNFGSAAFNGDARWLEIGVRPGELEDPNVYVILAPRQEVTPVPYALQTRGLFVDDNGNVGIGTRYPNFKLTLNDDGGIYAKGFQSHWVTIQAPLEIIQSQQGTAQPPAGVCRPQWGTNHMPGVTSRAQLERTHTLVDSAQSQWGPGQPARDIFQPRWGLTHPPTDMHQQQWDGVQLPAGNIQLP
jgi:hypothetical protein